MHEIEKTLLYEQGGLIAVLLGGLFLLACTAIVSVALVRIMYAALKKATGGEVGGSIIANIIRVAVWVVGLSIVFKACFNFDASVMLGALGIGGIALSLGLQNTISNLIGGLQISLSRDISLGDWVTIGAVTGQVKDITWRITKIHDSNGNVHIIPNSVLNTTAVSVLAPWQPVMVPLVFSRKADIDAILAKVPQIAADALKKAGYLHEDKLPLLAIDGTSVDAVNATLMLYANYTCSNMKVQDSVMPAVIEYLRSINALPVCGEE